MGKLVFKPAHLYAAAADPETPATQRPLPIRSTTVSEINREGGYSTWKEELDLLER